MCINIAVAAVFVAFEWTWDSVHKSAAAEVSSDEREVRFHINYSSGTAAVRGTRVMADQQYFWEVKMTTPVYGTDMVTSAVWDAFVRRRYYHREIFLTHVLQ